MQPRNAEALSRAYAEVEVISDVEADVGAAAIAIFVDGTHVDRAFSSLFAVRFPDATMVHLEDGETVAGLIETGGAGVITQRLITAFGQKVARRRIGNAASFEDVELALSAYAQLVHKPIPARRRTIMVTDEQAA